jgi:signal-transduction protein with cAMP-binding, CBS, and nucleotidyltransferase domain
MAKKVIQAGEVMRKEFVEIEGVATVRQAIAAFQDNNIQMLVVKKRDEHDAFGVVLLSDIVKKVLAKDKAVDRVNVYEIMSKPAISVDPALDIRYCARLFEQFGLSHALVTEHGEAIGVIGYKQLLMPWYEADQ